jgi:PAS domain S-box-containing protein
MSILTQAVDSCPSSFIVFNSMGVIVETNKTTAALFGYIKDELVGSNIERLLPTSLHQNYIKNFFNNPINIRLGDGKVLTGLRSDGSKINVEIGISFFNDERTTYGVVNIVDVTKEHAMRKLVERTQEVARIGSWQVDLKFKKCLWSKMTYKIHKLDERVEVAVEDAINFYALEHRALITECVDKGVSEGTSWDVELKIITTDNEELWVRAIGAPVYDENEVVGLEGTFQDIDKEKRLRLEREKLFNRLKKTEQFAEMGHWQWTIYPEKIEWSEGLYALWGLSPNQPPPSLEEHEKWIFKEDWHTVISTLHNAVERKEKYQVLFRAKINNQIKHIKGEGTPLFSGHEVIGFFGTVRDITEEVKSRDYINSLNKRLTLALKASKVGIWEWNVVTNELIWDQQMYHLYGIKEQDFEGAYVAWENGLHPDDKQGSVELINQAIKGEAKFDTEFRVVWPSGEVRYIRALASLEYDNDRRPVKMVGVNWDITSIKNYEANLLQTNKSLEQANNELMQFSYRASHDLKSPLVAMRGLAEAVVEDIQDHDYEEATINANRIAQQSQTLEIFVKDLLELAKIDASNMTPVKIDFERLSQEIVAFNQADAKQHDVQIITECNVKKEWELPQIRILQIINNLVANSVKYSDKGKFNRYVKLGISEGGDVLQLLVEDNGIGIPYENKSDIFEIFKRYHATKISGSGIGMYMVKKHIDALNGNIDFDSTPEGTTFCIKIRQQL